MMLYCAHCKREYPREDFSVKRRESYVLPSGHRLRFGAYHRRCGWTTMLQDLPVGERGKIAVEVKA